MILKTKLEQTLTPRSGQLGSKTQGNKLRAELTGYPSRFVFHNLEAQAEVHWLLEEYK